MAGRSALNQPFTAPLWNAPISSTGVTYSPAGLTPASGEGVRGSPIAIFMDPTQPSMDIQKAVGGTQGGGGNVSCGGTGQVFASVRIDPASIYPVGTDNNGFGAVHADGHTYAQGAGFARCTGYAYATAAKCLDTQDLLGDGLVGDTGASHLPIIGGCLRLGELSPGGSINHALQLICQSKDMYRNSVQSKTYRWPSTTSDGYYATTYAGTNPLLVMGALLALKPNFNLSQLTTTPAKMLATALMNYGGYIANTIGGSNALTVEVAPPGTGSVNDFRNRFQTDWAGSTGFPSGGLYFDQPHAAGNAWVNDCILIWANLQIVKIPSGDTAFGPGPNTPYGRVVANYGGTKVGAGWDGITGSGAPLVAFPADIGAASAGLARVGCTTTSPTAVSRTPTITRTLTAGNGLILCITNYDSTGAETVVSVSDGHNAYVQVPKAAATKNQLASDIWVCRNVTTGGAQTITVTMSGATGGTPLVLVEVSGQDTASFFDQVMNGVGITANPDSGVSGAASLTNEFVLGFIASHAGTPTTPVFGNALTSQTAETLAVSTATGGGCSGYVVDGLLATAVTEEFSATLAATAWTATVITFKPGASATVPGVPTGLIAVATGTTGQVKVTFTAPASNGGSAITDYSVQYRTTAGPGSWTTFSHTADPTATPITVTGLSAVSYDFQVAAVNAVGTGAYCAFVSATPAATPTAPSPPAFNPASVLGVGIDAIGPSDILFDWGPNPPNPGTQPITSYTLTVSVVGGGTFGTFTINDTNGPGGGPSLSVDVSGVALDIPYQATVTATNSVGTSAASAASAIATPTPPPGPPTQLTTNYPPAAHPAISPRYAALLQGKGN